jgi:CheY-like chemotaxis protein
LLKEYHPNVSIKAVLAKNLLNIIGSPLHLTKTVMNLVSNAAEAISGRGEVVISTTIRYVDRPIKGYDRMMEGDYVILTVSDTGIGISPEDMEKIFEPFYTKKTMGRSGTGLGMAVVWGTVKDHKGYIDVKSTNGVGTEVAVYFPATRKEKAEGKPQTQSVIEYTGKGEQILIVDDVQTQREIASSILERLGYVTASVSSGEAAIDYLKTQSADLVILDMIMPQGMDGYETYKRITEIKSDQKVMIASGFSESERVRKTQRLGAGSYIKKPYTLEKIGSTVRWELDRNVFQTPRETGSEIVPGM